MVSIERVELSAESWRSIEETSELNIFQTQPWLSFVAEAHHADPVTAQIKSNGRLVGYFSGLITHKLGLIILGSPFRGWLTYFMGFNLLPGAPKREILQAFPEFCFDQLGCNYLEIIDPNLILNDWEGLAYRSEHLGYYGIDLSPSEEELFANMDSTGRNCIRKSMKNGVAIEEAGEASFADEYYTQYENVMVKQSLTPAYSAKSVRRMVECTLPTGNTLLLRARNPQGESIATGIFLTLNKTAVFWGAASLSQYQSLRPNEAIAWYGMRALKARGVQTLHLGNKSEHYKEKLGAKKLEIHRLMRMKYEILGKVLYPLMSPKNDRFRNWALKRIS